MDLTFSCLCRLLGVCWISELTWFIYFFITVIKTQSKAHQHKTHRPSRPVPCRASLQLNRIAELYLLCSADLWPSAGWCKQGIRYNVVLSNPAARRWNKLYVWKQNVSIPAWFWVPVSFWCRFVFFWRRRCFYFFSWNLFCYLSPFRQCVGFPLLDSESDEKN